MKLQELSRERPTLARFTPARVALDRAGTSLTTRDHLGFLLDHALACDAVNKAADFARLLSVLSERGREALLLESAAAGVRSIYLKRPDLGRELDSHSATVLRSMQTRKIDVTFLIADGLSAMAINRHALALFEAIVPTLEDTWAIGPVCMVRNARVAIGDEIGELLGARLTVLMIGERPGLTAPDSLSVYLTWNPRKGRTDAERNCISNIRHGGLSYEEAARKVVFYMESARKFESTGFALKEGDSTNFQTLPADSLNKHVHGS